MGLWISNSSSGVSRVTNYGIMGSVDTGGNATTTLTLNNLGLMGGNNHHIAVERGSKVLIQNYMLKITETASTFNSFSSLNSQYNNFSHLVISDTNNNGGIITFKDGNSKIILDFGSGFELGKKYLISKVAVNQTGATPALGVDFSRLVPRSDLFTLTQSGEYFIATLNTGASAIGNLYKSNIRTMNNFYTMSNSMIYPHKYSAKRTTNKRRVIRRVKKTANLFNDSSLRENERSEFSWQSKSHDFNQPQITMNQERINDLDSWIASSATLPRNDEFLDLESLESLQSNESFAYKSDSNDYYANNATNPNSTNQTTTRRRITTTNQTNPNSNPNANRTLLNQSNDKYYFILTPFVNHNLFFESGRYNLSGFDYGFLTAFSARVAESNSLGTHFMMSYGMLGDSHDKDLSIKSMNFMLGLNYKLDLIYDMFLKARGDVFYFLNALDSATIKNIKPSNLGFGVSVSYGKDFDFKQGGILGIEVGLDYKALKTNKVSIDSQSYQKALYNLIYADLGLNYQKYFGGFGINLGGGFKANLAPNLAKSILLINSQNLDFALDNDKYLGYANVALSYVLNARNFDMEFSLAYYGNFGDRIVSNGGGVEWRVVF